MTLMLIFCGFFGVYILLNFARLIKRQMQPDYMWRAFWQSLLWLTVTEIAIVFFFRLANGLHVSLTNFFYGLAGLQLAFALVMLITTLKSLKRIKPPLLIQNYASSDLPTVSVCIPARNETEDLEADEPSAKKRLVKNPESFRQRAVKAADEAKKPTKRGRIRATVGGAFGFVFKPIGRLLKKLFDLRIFRILGRLLSPLCKVLFISYFRSSWQELKQVTWPNWRQSRQLTFAVLAFAVVFGAVIAGVDYGLDKLFRNILLK